MKIIKQLESYLPYLLITSLIISGFVSGFTYPLAICFLPLCMSLIGHRYFETKEKVITENEFRAKVNEDMSLMKHQVATQNAFAGGNPFKVK